jgi:rhodanese-related sulfurtransferase
MLPDLPVIAPSEVVRQLAERDKPVLVDIRASSAFRESHIAGAIWSIRPRGAELAGSLPTGAEVVLVTDDPAAARAYALDFTEQGRTVRGLLSAPLSDWVSSGLPVESSPNGPTDADRIDFLFFVHDRHEGNLDSARRYLAWETGLVDSLDPDERAAFRIRADSSVE